MDSNNVPLHQEDDIVFDDDYDFSDAIFDLEEPEIPRLSNNYSTPVNKIKLKFKNFDNLLKIAHISILLS